MSNKILKFELIEGIPEDNGIYFLLLEDGSIKQGYLGSFSFPYHQKDIVRIADCESEKFHYEKCVGWLKPIK
ncbi:hypothetical protein [Anabaena sp. CCY 9910]|uniref:hypothetical protein n=1 Tax=Anabaena sp. CCY 9910 TaxID=3103870 RepID=UPI0039E15B99